LWSTHYGFQWVTPWTFGTKSTPDTVARETPRITSEAQLQRINNGPPSWRRVQTCLGFVEHRTCCPQALGGHTTWISRIEKEAVAKQTWLTNAKRARNDFMLQPTPIILGTVHAHSRLQNGTTTHHSWHMYLASDTVIHGFIGPWFLGCGSGIVLGSWNFLTGGRCGRWNRLPRSRKRIQTVIHARTRGDSPHTVKLGLRHFLAATQQRKQEEALQRFPQNATKRVVRPTAHRHFNVRQSSDGFGSLRSFQKRVTKPSQQPP
jgi:hypothetical protein